MKIDTDESAKQTQPLSKPLTLGIALAVFAVSTIVTLHNHKQQSNRPMAVPPMATGNALKPMLQGQSLEPLEMQDNVASPAAYMGHRLQTLTQQQTQRQTEFKQLQAADPPDH